MGDGSDLPNGVGTNCYFLITILVVMTILVMATVFTQKSWNISREIINA